MIQPSGDDATPSWMIEAPPGIETALCGSKALLAFQRQAALRCWRVPGRSSLVVEGRPWLMRKYESFAWELYLLLFPERESLPAALSCVWKLLGAIEPALLLYFQVEDLRRKRVPFELREAVFRYMRFHNVSLADFGLEPNKIAVAFKGFQYGVERFDELKPRLATLRRVAAELREPPERLKDAWLLCLESLSAALNASEPSAQLSAEALLRDAWGPNGLDLLERLIALFGFESVSGLSAQESAPGSKAWLVERKGEKLAPALALADGASVEALASELGLDPAEAGKWLHDKEGKTLGASPSSVKRGDVYLVPNVWIAADLMRGGDLIDRFLNLGGTLGSFIGTDLFTYGFKVEKPETFGDLISAIGESKGCLWGIVLFSHGAPGGSIYDAANITGLSSSNLVGDIPRIVDALKGNGFKIAKAYPSQCYSAYEGKVIYKNLRRNGQEDAYRDVDWESRWNEVAIYVHGYSGWNVAWVIDTGCLRPVLSLLRSSL